MINAGIAWENYIVVVKASRENDTDVNSLQAWHHTTLYYKTQYSLDNIARSNVMGT